MHDFRRVSHVIGSGQLPDYNQRRCFLVEPSAAEIDVTIGDTARPLRVLVMAAYPTVRAGLQTVVEHDQMFALAGLAESFQALSDDIEHLAPDVILLDGGTDLDALIEVLASLSTGDLLPPVVLMARDIDDLVEAIEAGVTGFLLPDASPEEIGAALIAAFNGLTTIDSRAVTSFLRTMPVRDTSPPEAESYQALTTRESEVLQLIAQGLPNKAIAIELGISEHTVKFHVGSILAKLGASSRSEALARAARAGLIVL